MSSTRLQGVSGWALVPLLMIRKGLGDIQQLSTLETHKPVGPPCYPNHRSKLYYFFHKGNFILYYVAPTIVFEYMCIENTKGCM